MKKHLTYKIFFLLNDIIKIAFLNRSTNTIIASLSMGSGKKMPTGKQAEIIYMMSEVNKVFLVFVLTLNIQIIHYNRN
jgi:hypothetical protein